MFDHRLFWTDSFCRRHGWWVLLLLALLLYLPGTSILPLMDRDEPRFAQATVEMMERGSWSVPYFNGDYRFDKPPLTYWWMWLNYRLLGISEIGARLHGVLAVFLTALIIRGLAQRLSGKATTGLTAALLWLTTAQTLIHGRLCVADMPMILCVTLACRALLELVLKPDDNPHGLWWWTLWLSLGFGFLAKGPIAWLVPGLTLLLWRYGFWRRPISWKPLHVMPGLAVMLLPVAAWGIPALIETQGLFWDIGMGRHVVKRGVEVLNGRKFIPGYYLVSTWLSLFPWLFFLMPVWRLLRAEWSMDKAFLVAWFVTPQIVFSFYATQLPHYVMPGYPAYLVLLALAWDKKHPLPKLATMGLLGLAGLIFTWAVPAWFMPVAIPEVRDLAQSTATLVVGLFSLGGIAALCAWKANGAIQWGMPLIAVISCSLALMPFSQQLRKTSVTLQVANYLEPLTQEMRLLAQGFDEPSLVFYTQHAWEMGIPMSEIKKQLALPGPCSVVLLRREWTLDGWFKSLLGQRPRDQASKDRSAEVDAFQAAFPNLTRHVVQGFNGARSSWTEVVVFIRRL